MTRQLWLVESGERDYSYAAGAFDTLEAAQAAVEAVVTQHGWTRFAWAWSSWQARPDGPISHSYLQDAHPYWAAEHSPFVIYEIPLNPEPSEIGVGE